MAYDPTDPRAQLQGDARRALGSNVAPQYFEFDTSGVTETQWVRGQACIVGFSNTDPGQTLQRSNQPDEYMVLLPGEARARLTAGTDTVETSGPTLAVMPPGSSEIMLPDGGDVVRIFSSQSADLTALCRNADFYTVPDPNVAPFTAWPDPPGGHHIRAYALDAIAPSDDRFGRLFRCSTLMVNYFYPDPGPRDPAKMSPHHHEDFEQISLQLAGDYVHHIRTPWSPDMSSWREDEHQRCSSPSVTVIPPPSIHTSQSIGDHVHQLVDIFCPPRSDFSARPGWVLNADHYPAPTTDPTTD